MRPCMLRDYAGKIYFKKHVVKFGFFAFNAFTFVERKQLKLHFVNTTPRVATITLLTFKILISQDR